MSLSLSLFLSKNSISDMSKPYACKKKQKTSQELIILLVSHWL